jgi:hypothetical protein
MGEEKFCEDVPAAVKRFEYEKVIEDNKELSQIIGDLKLVNLDLAETNKNLLAEHNKLEKIRSIILRFENKYDHTSSLDLMFEIRDILK